MGIEGLTKSRPCGRIKDTRIAIAGTWGRDCGPPPGCTGNQATQHSRVTLHPALLYLSKSDLAIGREK